MDWKDEILKDFKPSGFFKETEPMTNKEIAEAQSMQKTVELSHQCRTENGITDEEVFRIAEIIGNYSQLVVMNQYDQKFTINPKQLL